MKHITIILMMCFLTAQVQAEQYSEKVKIDNFQCNSGRPGVVLRSLERDRFLYLAKNNKGAPEFLEISNHHCELLIKNLSNRLKGEILVANFETSTFSRTESVYVPPSNPCDSFNTRKCEYFGHDVEKTFVYLLTETILDGYRFFSEENIGEL